MPPGLQTIGDRIWLIPYPINYLGNLCDARCTLIRMGDGSLFVHSPSPLTGETRALVESLGPVSAIVAPGTFHHLNALAWHREYPQAAAYRCPGLERRRPALAGFTAIEDGGAYPWGTEFAHLRTRGSWVVNEVAFLHRPTRTLLLVDLIENFTDATRCNWQVRFWFKAVFRMWNNPKPAPEYQLGWSSRKKARAVLAQICDWDFDRIIMGHGEVVHTDGKAVARRAWRSLLG